jgi:tRNA threonylcarbamoyl adenosine modification protein YeaZ
MSKHSPSTPSDHHYTMLCVETSGALCGVALAEFPTSELSTSELSTSELSTSELSTSELSTSELSTSELSVGKASSMPHQDLHSPFIIAELSFYESHQHDRVLAEATRTLCAMTNRPITSIHAVAVSAGPGSFTGLRIGAAFAKALCFDDRIDDDATTTPDAPRLVAIPTMTAIAYAARQASQMLGKQKIVVATPSHKDLVYWQEFSTHALSISDIHLVQAEEISPNAHTFYAGAYFGNHPNPDFTSLSDFCHITTRMIAHYAAVLVRQQAFTPASEFVPLYAQEFVPKTL